MRRMNRWTSALRVLTFLLFPLAASAGGPLAPPDGVGNPDGGDYTGFYTVGWVIGVRDTALMHTEVRCMNFGVVAADIALQFYTASDTVDRDPVGIGSMGFTVIGLLVNSDTVGIDAGVVVDRGLMRIIAADGLRKKNAALRCTAHLIDRATATQIGSLQVITPTPKKKKKRR